MIASRNEILRRIPMALLGSYAWGTTFLDRPGPELSLFALVSLGTLWLGIPFAREGVLRGLSLFGFLGSTALAIVSAGTEEPFGLPWFGWLGWFGFALTWGLTPPATEGEPSPSGLPARRVLSRSWGLVPLLAVASVVGLGVPLRQVATVERHSLAVVLLVATGILLLRVLTDLVPSPEVQTTAPVRWGRGVAFLVIVGLSIALWAAG